MTFSVPSTPLVERARVALRTVRPVAELRLLDASAAMMRTQREAHVISLAVWCAGVEGRGRSALNGTLLASEQREYDRRVRDIRELELRAIPTMTADEARLRFLTTEGN